MKKRYFGILKPANTGAYRGVAVFNKSKCVPVKKMLGSPENFFEFATLETR